MVRESEDIYITCSVIEGWVKFLMSSTLCPLSLTFLNKKDISRRSYSEDPELWTPELLDKQSLDGEPGMLVVASNVFTLHILKY